MGALRSTMSEFGLIKYRVLVEVRWLQQLSRTPEVMEVPPFSPAADKFLNDLVANFSVEDALEVKRVERTTNHDVKVFLKP